MEIFERIAYNIESFVVSFLSVDLWRVLLCVAIIFAALLIKTFISKCVFKILGKKLKKEDGTESIISEIINILDRPIQIVVIAIAIQLCSAVLHLSSGFSQIVSQTVTSIIIIAAFWAMYNAAGDLKVIISKVTAKSETHIDDIALNYIGYAIKAVVIILCAICVLQIWVGNISGLIAGLSIGGVAFALAAQETAASLFGSITVMLDRPFEIGEYIEVDGVAGTVEKMGLRSTHLRTVDCSLVIVPNKIMGSAKIVNWTKIDRRRVLFNIGVTYSTTKEQLEELISRIKAMLEARDDIRKEGIMVGFAEFADSALEISIRFYTLTGDLAEATAMRGTVNFAIMQIVNEMGLSFAFPSRSIYIENADAKAEDKE